MKPEELVARHLEATGLVGDVLKSRISLSASGTGNSRYMTGGKGGPYSGQATLLSQGSNLLLRVPYQDPLYQGELVAYDGKEVRATDTPLGRLAYWFQTITKEGLFGGVYCIDWALATWAERKAKLKYKGLKKKDDRRLHELQYSPKGGSDVQVTLYFEPESLHHVLTQYKIRLSHPTSDPNRPGRTERYTLEEHFSDFRPADDLILPYCWQIKIFEPSASMLVEIVCDRFLHNVPIDPKTFSLK